jgi:hypothetical protein
MDMPTRIDIVRRHGIEVSDDGFTPTLDGPVHIDDSRECRSLIRHNLIQQAADRMVDAINLLLAVEEVEDVETSLLRLERARNDYQDACDLDELPPMQEARIRGSVPWNVGRD